MDYSKVITGLLSRAYKLDEGEIAELIKEGENITEDSILNVLLEKDAARVAQLKKATDTQGKFQEGYAKAKKEERELFERELKEKFGVESDAKGVDLIEAIVTEKAGEAGKGKKGEVTEDDVKKHPVYQTLETKYRRDLTAKDAEWKTKLEEVETNYKKNETFGTVKSKALNLLDGLKPILPGNPEIAANQKNWFVSALEGYEYEIQGDRTVVMKDGKVVEDSHGNSLGFDELVKSKASQFFEFQKNNGGGNAGNSNEGGNSGNGGAGYPAGIQKPKSLEELAKITSDASIKLEDRQKVMEVYEQENSNG